MGRCTCSLSWGSGVCQEELSNVKLFSDADDMVLLQNPGVCLVTALLGYLCPPWIPRAPRRLLVTQVPAGHMEQVRDTRAMAQICYRALTCSEPD